jgi:hypothetical protein
MDVVKDCEELDGPVVRVLRRVIAEVKQHWLVIAWGINNLLSRAPPCFGRHVKPLVLHLESLAPTNPHWARVVAHSPYVSIRKAFAPAVGILIGW